MLKTTDPVLIFGPCPAMGPIPWAWSTVNTWCRCSSEVWCQDSLYPITKLGTVRPAVRSRRSAISEAAQVVEQKVCCTRLHTAYQCLPTRVPRHIVRSSSRNLGKNKNFYQPQEFSNAFRNIKGSFWPSVGTTGVVSAHFQLPLHFVFVFACKSSWECENYTLGGPACEKGWEILFCTCERYTVEILYKLLASKRLCLWLPRSRFRGKDSAGFVNELTCPSPSFHGVIAWFWR